MWIDAHCHLQFDDVGLAAADRATSAGVDQMICVGTDAETSEAAIQLALLRPSTIRATVGLHPHDARLGAESLLPILDNLTPNSRDVVVGIGECGLDYYYNHSPRIKQKESFAFQIDLAKRYDLALVVHTRDAWNDTLDILRTEGPPPRTVIHCFTGGPEEAKKCLDQGFYLSFSGIVTFKKSVEVLAAAQICPVEQMTIETDSPFLAPVPYRGKPNEPAFVGIIGRYLSEMKNLQLEAFSEAVTTASKRLYNLQ